MPMSPHRPALAGMLLAIIAVLALQSTPTLAADPSTPVIDRVAATAIKYEGTYQGDCWPFVLRVVLEATGRQIGFDYRQGFFDAGAVEVKLDEAQGGDIIQIVNDANTAPDADYIGMHTSIVYEVLGNGIFNVVDSNSQWDGIVRLRPNYDPAAAAARYSGLTFHIYRITGTGPSSAAPVPPAASAIQPGDQVTVKTPGDCLNMRSGPGLDQSPIACLPDGSVVSVLAGPLNVGGRLWVQVDTPSGRGWAATEFLAAAAAGPAGSGGTKPLLQFRTFVPAVAGN